MNPTKLKRSMGAFALSAVLTAASIASPTAGVAEEVAPNTNRWESVASLGISLTRGNSHNFLGTASVNSKRKWASDEMLLGANGGYGETKTRVSGSPSVTSKTDDYLKGFAQWNHLFDEHWYAGLRLDGVHDDIADLDYRFTLSPLVGYYFIKTPETSLSAEAGPSVVHEKQGGKEKTYFALRIAERGEHKFKTGAKIWETVEFVPQVDDFDNWIMNAELGVSAPITKSFDVRLVAQDTYDNEPAAGRLKNDFKLIAALGFKF